MWKTCGKYAPIRPKSTQKNAGSSQNDEPAFFAKKSEKTVDFKMVAWYYI